MTVVSIGGQWGNVIIDFNTFYHSNQLRLLICYIGYFDNKTVEIVYVVICVSSYHIMTVLIARLPVYFCEVISYNDRTNS